MNAGPSAAPPVRARFRARRAALELALALVPLLPLFASAARAFEPVTLSERSYLLRFMPPTLPSNLILSLAADPLDTRSVYVGTSEGLCRTNGRFFRRHGTGGQEGPEGRDVNAILHVRHYLLVATDEGLSMYNGLTERWTHYGTKQGLPVACVQCLAEYGVEALVGTWGGGVRLFDPVKGAFRDFPVAGFEKAHVTALWGDPQTKRAAVGTLQRGIALVGPQGVRALSREGDKFPSDRVNGIAAGEAGRLFVATGAGLVELAGEELVLHTAESGMTSSNALCVAADPYGAWVGTDRGVSRLSGGKWTAHPVKNALSGGNPVRVISILRVGGRIYLGTNHQGLLYADER